MDVTSPLLLGGLPFSPGEHPITPKSLDGCIRNVLVNQAPLNLGSPIAEKNTRVGCDAKKDFCVKNPCINQGKCISSWKSALCQCPEEFAGKTCEISKYTILGIRMTVTSCAACALVLPFRWLIFMNFSHVVNIAI